MAKVLEHDGIAARCHQGDVTDAKGISELIGEISNQVPIDCCFFQPGTGQAELVDVLDVYPEDLLPYVQRYLVGGIAVTQALLPAMRARRAGTLVYVGGGAAKLALPAYGNVGPVMAALRSYARTVRAGLAGTGVSAAFLAIGGVIADTAMRPGEIPSSWIADRSWTLVHDLDVDELLVAEPTAAPTGGSA